MLILRSIKQTGLVCSTAVVILLLLLVLVNKKTRTATPDMGQTTWN